MTPGIHQLAERLADRATARGAMVTTAESCTGGLLAGAITDIPGASAVLERGFVAYSNESKMQLLGVDPRLIAAHGAVSAEVASAMATGALERSSADVAVSITGIAGPEGGSAAKPVGLVFFAVAARGHAPRIESRLFPGASRAFVREKAVEAALEMLIEVL